MKGGRALLIFQQPSDYILGASVSLHLWSSSFPFLPHPHFHVVLPHFSYLNINDTCAHKDGKLIHVPNFIRDDCETLLSQQYDSLYSFVQEQDISGPDTDKKVFRFIDKSNLDQVSDLKVEISKDLSRLLHFKPLSWDGKIIKTSDRGIDYEVSLPVDVDVFRCIWTDCVREVFKKELDSPSGVDLDVDVCPVYDIHNQWVKPVQKAKLMHHLQYKCRPPILDLDLFFRKCSDFVIGYDSLNPESVLSFIRSKFVSAAVAENVAAASRYESLLQKAESMFSKFSIVDIYSWLQFLCVWRTQTRVFGFWRDIKRYRVTSVLRGELPRVHICPICGGDTERVCMTDVLYVDAIVVHLGSRFLLVDIKDPPDPGGLL